jgi:hypothetical protein
MKRHCIPLTRNLTSGDFQARIGTVKLLNNPCSSQKYRHAENITTSTTTKMAS